MESRRRRGCHVDSPRSRLGRGRGRARSADRTRPWCLRRYHAACAGGRLIAAGGAWRCVACAAPPADAASLDEELKPELLERLEAACAAFPRAHFASLFGDRVAAVRRFLAAAPAPSRRATLAGVSGLHDVCMVASRLHFAGEVAKIGARQLAAPAAPVAQRSVETASEFAGDLDKLGMTAVAGARPACAVGSRTARRSFGEIRGSPPG